MRTVLLVAAGGAIGAAARHLLSAGALRLAERGAFSALPSGWPHGTFAANILGGLAMGLVVEWAALRGGGAETRQWLLFLATGVLGGFTTFSAYSLEVVRLMRADRLWVAGAYAGMSVALAVGAVMAGLWLGRRVFA